MKRQNQSRIVIGHGSLHYSSSSYHPVVPVLPSSRPDRLPKPDRTRSYPFELHVLSCTEYYSILLHNCYGELLRIDTIARPCLVPTWTPELLNSAPFSPFALALHQKCPPLSAFNSVQCFARVIQIIFSFSYV